MEKENQLELGLKGSLENVIINMILPDIKNQIAEEIDILSIKVKKLFDNLKGMRKEALKNGSEMAEGNIIYKIIRRLGYIGKIFDLKRMTFDKINSIK